MSITWDDLTWEPLQALAGFVAVSDAQIADAIRLLVRTTHNLAEGAGAAGHAGLRVLRDQLGARATVAIVLSGSHIDARPCAAWSAANGEPADHLATSAITWSCTSRFSTGRMAAISSSANVRCSGGGSSRAVLFMIEIA
ncbi:MAG TPA: pyridoxal-phosphate dependent enzyme [Kofleriaceae bacterium]|nr:pyridoxal-phosphate dependent enzyme [Kofleriaceae bacterium]